MILQDCERLEKASGFLFGDRDTVRSRYVDRKRPALRVAAQGIDILRGGVVVVGPRFDLVPSTDGTRTFTPQDSQPCRLLSFPKIDFQGSSVTSDGGLILMRELDEQLGLGELITQHLTDSRREKNTHTQTGFRLIVASHRSAGWTPPVASSGRLAPKLNRTMSRFAGGAVTKPCRLNQLKSNARWHIVCVAALLSAWRNHS
jgi:hypothetical protein